MSPIDAYLSLKTQHRNGEISWHEGLGVLQTQAGIAIFLASPP